MSPYKVVLIPPKGDRLDLVVPFNGKENFQNLTATVLARASKYRSLPTHIRQTHLKLSLGSEDGFLVEPEDTVEDIITASDVLFIAWQDETPIGTGTSTSHSLAQYEAKGAVQIRIITPNIAPRNIEFLHTSLLQGGRYYPPSTTLREIKNYIAQHLRLPSVLLEELGEQECNCKLAELLVRRGVWDRIACDDQNCVVCSFGLGELDAQKHCAKCSQPLIAHDGAAHEARRCETYVLRRRDLSCGHVIHSKCLNTGPEFDCHQSCYSAQSQKFRPHQATVVSGYSHIETLELTDSTHGALMRRLADRFGEDFTSSKVVFCKGGSGNEENYTRLPVVAVCASQRHQSNPHTAQPSESLSGKKLDLHTVEGPINTTNLGLTLKDARLDELVVKDVLTIYAVEWNLTGQPKKLKGNDGMFAADSHWELPSIQSDRGMAAVLASLRVFAHIIGSEDFDDFRQNEVLRIVHLLTCFPPAVRAVHILMDGKTLQPNESAALAQSLAAAAEEVIPRELIANDTKRSLEGARLLLGLVLHRLRQPETRQIDSEKSLGQSTSKLPYIAAYHTIDLRDIKTLEPVTEPVMTNLGLVNRGVFEAFSNSGLLQYSPACDLTDCSIGDCRRLRVALLFGGVALETPYYEADALGAAFDHSAASKFLLDMKALSTDIPYLASLCEETRLVVVAPRLLSNAKAPSLTLDRYGNLAVYTGRAACAAPGHDHAVFHPLTGKEENVDVNIVAQSLEPILMSREQDGTILFDLFSATYRKKDASPTELIVFCVDCSSSMNQSSDFEGLNDDDSLPDLSGMDHLGDVVLEDEDDTVVPLEEVKSWLCEHESYDDILHIVHHYRAERRRPQEIAEEVIAFLRELTSRHLSHLTDKQRDVSRWATPRYSRNNSVVERQMNSLRRTLTGLNIHNEALTDFLIFTARDPGFVSKGFVWSYGEPFPSSPSSEENRDTVDMSGFCIIPHEYLCPISQVVFEEPVLTSDGFTFERKAIQRWYRMRKSSPLTGLPIEDETLRDNQVLANQIKAWVRADDVIESLPSTPKRTRLSRRQSKAVLSFVAPNVRFTREVPPTVTLLDLHKLAFRGMRGLYSRFSLHMRSTFLPCSEEIINEKGVAGNQSITISPNSTPDNDNSAASTGGREICLIRVYSSHKSSHEMFKYWVPLHSDHTFTSILFRHWRYLVQTKRSRYPPYDRAVWSDLRDGGDSVGIGSTNSSWSSLSHPLYALPRIELQSYEELYQPLSGPKRNMDSASSIRLTLDETTSGDDDALSESQYPRCRVFKVCLYGYVSPREAKMRRVEKQKRLSRLSVTKQIFNAFINRLIAYNFPTNVGLVTFGTKAKVSQKLTDVIENFRLAVEKMEADGDTALWDSLALAADQLVETARRYPDIKKRIFCLSDGKDTCSVKKVEDVCRTLREHEIVVDSVIIGNEDNSLSRTVSYLSGGYKFVPNSVEEAAALCELEPVLSLHERPPINCPSVSSFFNFLQAIRHANPDPVTRDQFPQRKAHENLSDTFVRVDHFDRFASVNLSPPSTSAKSAIRSRRLLLEIRDIANQPHPSYDVYVSESNMGFWKIVLQGPNGSAYATGTFLLYLDMGDDYPRRAPSGRFITPIFHPNVNRHGRICHSIFDRNWTVDTTNKQILDTVFGLLLVPEFSDPINTVVTLNYYWDEVAFKDEVVKHITEHASITRAQWEKEILGEV